MSDGRTEISADGWNEYGIPIGVRKIDSMRTLTTESLGSLIPFRTQEVMDKGGIYCGINAISHNLILVNRGLLLNPSAFILGVPGSGKSMLTKMFILLIILSTTKDQVLVYDPEGEYEPLVQALGGVSLPVSAGSDIHLNAMDMVKGYGDKNPIVDKSQFVLSLYERITDDRYIIGPKEKVSLTAVWSVFIPRNVSMKFLHFLRCAGSCRSRTSRRQKIWL